MSACAVQELARAHAQQERTRGHDRFRRPALETVPNGDETSARMTSRLSSLLPRVLQRHLHPTSSERGNKQWMLLLWMAGRYHLSLTSQHVNTTPRIVDLLPPHQMALSVGKERHTFSDQLLPERLWPTQPMRLQPRLVVVAASPPRTCPHNYYPHSTVCHAPSPLPTAEIEASSVLKKRRRKMNKHKYKKCRKKFLFLRRRLGK